MQFRIDRLSCGGCVKTVSAVIAALDPGARIEVDLAAKTLSLDTAVPVAAVQDALRAAGYPATAR